MPDSATVNPAAEMLINPIDTMVVNPPDTTVVQTNLNDSTLIPAPEVPETVQNESATKIADKSYTNIPLRKSFLPPAIPQNAKFKRTENGYEFTRTINGITETYTLNNRKRITKYEIGNEHTKRIYSYNNKGYCNTIEKYENGEHFSTKNFEYIKFNVHGKYQVNKITTQYHKSGDTEIREFNVTSSGKRLNRKYVYIYKNGEKFVTDYNNVRGRKELETRYDSKGRPTCELLFDKKGRVRYRWQKDNYSSRYTLIEYYDAKGNPLKVKFLDADGNRVDYSSRGTNYKTYVVDSNGTEYEESDYKIQVLRGYI